MERSAALEMFKTFAVESLDVEPEQVTEDASFKDDLEADSLDLVELVMMVEEELEIRIPQEQLEPIVTVGDALDVVLNAQATVNA